MPVRRQSVSPLPSPSQAELAERHDGSWARRYCEIAPVAGGQLDVCVFAVQGALPKGRADWVGEVTVRSEADGNGVLETTVARTVPEWNGGRGETLGFPLPDAPAVLTVKLLRRGHSAAAGRKGAAKRVAIGFAELELIGEKFVANKPWKLDRWVQIQSLKDNSVTGLKLRVSARWEPAARPVVADTKTGELRASKLPRVSSPKQPAKHHPPMSYEPCCARFCGRASPAPPSF